MMSRLVGVVVGLMVLVAACGAQERPNVVLILADDLGWSDIGSYGSEVRTPALDKLAENGVRFQQFYNTAKCFPSRASLLTGLYAQQVGMADKPNTRIQNGVTLGEVLRSAGYATLAAGKHHGLDNLYDRGFDRYWGMRDGATNHFNPGLWEAGEPEPAMKQPKGRMFADDGLVFNSRDPEHQDQFPDDYYSSDTFTDKALAFIKEQHAARPEQPFFLYLAYTAPHDPLQAREEDIAKYEGVYDAGYEATRKKRYEKQLNLGIIDGERYRLSTAVHRDWAALTEEEKADQTRRMEVYAAMIDVMDRNIARVVALLEEQGELENTVILFCSDNGASAEMVEIGDGRIGAVNRWASLGRDWANVGNTPFRLWKNENTEGGINSPLIVHWPAGIKRRGEIIDAPHHFIDVMPTLVELSGASYPTEHGGEAVLPMEGVSLLPVLKGQAPNERAEPLFFQWRTGGAIIEGRYKLVKESGDRPWQLFDMKRDRTEMQDLAGERPELVKTLIEKHTQWLARTQ